MFKHPRASSVCMFKHPRATSDHPLAQRTSHPANQAVTHCLGKRDAKETKKRKRKTRTKQMHFLKQQLTSTASRTVVQGAAVLLLALVLCKETKKKQSENQDRWSLLHKGECLTAIPNQQKKHHHRQAVTIRQSERHSWQAPPGECV